MFINRYRNKSNKELTDILNNNNKYVEEAVIAAKYLLEERKGNTELLKELKSVQTQIDLKRNQDDRPSLMDIIESNDNSLDVSPDAIKLYSKNTIFLITVFLGIPFGMTLLIFNLYKAKSIKIAMMAFIFGTVYFLAEIYSYLLFGKFLISIFLLNAGAALVFTGVFWRKGIGEQEYQSKDWVLPTFMFALSLFTVILLVYFLL